MPHRWPPALCCSSPVMLSSKGVSGCSIPRFPVRQYGGVVTVVVNHLHLSDALTAETEQSCRDIVPRIRDAGGMAARVVQVDDTRLVLILEFASAEDADLLGSRIRPRPMTRVSGSWCIVVDQPAEDRS